jgi:hypothetical protein
MPKILVEGAIHFLLNEELNGYSEKPLHQVSQMVLRYSPISKEGSLFLRRAYT